MSKHGKQTHIETDHQDKPSAIPFTGTVYTMDYKPHEGFANYCVVTLEIVDGIVVKREEGQAYNAVECRQKLELKGREKLETMRRNYPAGFRHG